MKKITTISLLALLAASPALGQSSPHWAPHYRVPVSAWDSTWAGKQDVNGDAGGQRVTATGGTSARRLADRASDCLNIKDFGVTHDPSGTNVAANTAAYQTAIDAAGAAGCRLVHSKGMTVTHTGLFINASMELQINGTLFLAPWSAGLIRQCCLVINASNVTVRLGASGVIDGNWTNQNIANAGIDGLFTVNGVGGIVTTQNIANAPGTGLTDIYIYGPGTVQNVANWPVSICSVNRSKIIGLRMINANNAPQVTAGCTNFEVAGCYVQNIADYGIAAYQGCSYGSFHHNIFVNVATIGVLNDGSVSTGWNGYPNHDIAIHDNLIEGATDHGIAVLNVAYAVPAANNYNIDIHDNKLINVANTNVANSQAFLLVNCRNVTVKRNTVDGGGSAGTGMGALVFNDSTAVNIVVEDNIVQNLNTGNTRYGLIVGATGLIARRNIIRDTRASPSMNYGISGTAASGTILDGNIVQGMVTASYGYTPAGDTIFLDGGNDNFAKPKAIGNTTPAAGTFTTLSSTGLPTIGTAASGAGSINIGSSGSTLSSNVVYNAGFKYIATDYAWLMRSNGSTGVNLSVAGSGTAGTTFTGVTAWSAANSGNVSFPNGVTITGGTVDSAAIGGTTPASGKFTTLAASAPATITGATYSVGAGDFSLILNPSAGQTLTLPVPATYVGRLLTLKLISAFAVTSASANVVGIAGGAAGTAILAATAGKWATLQSDGTNWQIMAAG